MSSVDPASSPQLGSYFLESYEPLEIIGAGGFGYVLKAIRREDAAAVAVKLILKSRMGRSALIRSRWEAAPGLEAWSTDADDTLIVPLEAYVMRKAAHDSVVAYIDLFGDENYFYLVSSAFAFSVRYKGKTDIDCHLPGHGAPRITLEEA